MWVAHHEIIHINYSQRLVVLGLRILVLFHESFHPHKVIQRTLLSFPLILGNEFDDVCIWGSHSILLYQNIRLVLEQAFEFFMERKKGGVGFLVVLHHLFHFFLLLPSKFEFQFLVISFNYVIAVLLIQSPVQRHSSHLQRPSF